MTLALTLARRGLGQVWPNPAVGCVIATPDGRILGRGWTQPGGRPHAETVALAAAGAGARGATAYVTLEPCCHHGQTPPCSDALIAAGVARVVAACADPDPRVAGGGLARLRAAGLAVEYGLLGKEAEALNRGFLLKVTAGRPLVTLKLAASLDGRIATVTGASQWITGAAARAAGHRLRAGHDAILVGIGTVLADNPSLTCRLPGLEARSPLRVVLDSGLGIPPSCHLATSAAQNPTWVLTCARGLTPTGFQERCAALETLGVTVLTSPAGADGRLALRPALAALAARGITRVLCEGGATLAGALLREQLVDRLEWFQAPLLIGGDGRAATEALGVKVLAEAVKFTDAVPDRRLDADHYRSLVPIPLPKDHDCLTG